MDLVTFVIILGFLGGVVIALLLFRMHPRASQVDPLRDLPITTDVINMARIRVSGVGGLGLVAMALTVALMVPRIRQHLIVSALLGIVFGLVLIWLRRAHGGPMPSSSGTSGANNMLSLDLPPGPPAEEDRRVPPSSRVRHARP